MNDDIMNNTPGEGISPADDTVSAADTTSADATVPEAVQNSTAQEQTYTSPAGSYSPPPYSSIYTAATPTPATTAAPSPVPSTEAETEKKTSSVFAEQDFGSKAQTYQPTQGYGQPYGAPNYSAPRYGQPQYGQPYRQPVQPGPGAGPQYGYGQYGQPQNGQASAPTSSQTEPQPVYREQSFGSTAQSYQNTQGYQSYSSQNPYNTAHTPPPYTSQYGYGAPAAAPAEPVVPPVSAPSETKKTSTVVMVVMAVIVVVLLSAVMILLAIKAKNTPQESGLDATVSPSQTGNVTVNIEMDKRPAEDKSDYADEEKGLFTVQGAVRYALPSVVSLYGYKNGTPAPISSASGTILSKDGYIVTNAHVVDDVDSIGVTLHDGTKFKGKIIASDQRTDVAIIKIEADDLTPAVIGSADDLVQGDTVITIGNADGFENSVTTGIVSYNDRTIESYTGYDISCIQTDAALNHGQSGGAVIDLYGRVVGIVVSKYYSSETENLGFAIRSEEFVPVCEELIAKGFVPGRPRMGIIYNFIDADYAEKNGLKVGTYVTEISSDCDIANTELKVGDIITEVGEIKFNTVNDVKKIAVVYKPGDTVKAKVFRKDQFSNDEGQEFEIEFTFDEFQE